METAISKQMKSKIEKLFQDNARTSGNKAIIHVNSVITEEQENNYKQASKER